MDIYPYPPLHLDINPTQCWTKANDEIPRIPKTCFVDIKKAYRCVKLCMDKEKNIAECAVFVHYLDSIASSCFSFFKPVRSLDVWECLLLFFKTNAMDFTKRKEI